MGKNNTENERHVFEEKLTKGGDIDEDVLLESFQRNEKNSLKIFLNGSDEVFRIFDLLFHVVFCDHVKIFVIAIGADFKRILNDIAQFLIKNPGFNKLFPEKRNHPGMFFIILPGKRQNCSCSVKNSVIGPVCRRIK